MRELALLQVLLPLLLAAWLSLGRAPSRLDLALRVVGAWLLLAGLWLAGIWLALPPLAAGVLAILLALASLAAVYRVRAVPKVHKHAKLWTGRLVSAAAAFLGGWLLVPALAGRAEPSAAIDLQLPLRGGRYLVANGGSTERINAHLLTLGPRYGRWRGESYGVDLIKVDEYGFRTRQRRLLAQPRDPAAYLSFGEPVYAPCSGRVEATESARPDMPVPVRDRRHLEGNFVRLRCGQVVVLLAHFRKGGVRVAFADQVLAGQMLGWVGNSGNSDEPHLHVHVQRPAAAGAPLSGDPLFATFDGLFPVRNMIISQGGTNDVRHRGRTNIGETRS